MAKRPRPFRVGDLATIVVPRFVTRVGYPKTLKDYLPLIEANRPAFHEYLAKMDQSFAPKGVTFHKDRLLDKTLRKVEMEIAYILAKADGFGGEVRSIHTVDKPEYLEATVRIQSVRTAHTGIHVPPTMTRCSWEYEDYDYDPGGLGDEKRHRIAEVSIVSRHMNWSDFTPITTSYPEIEVANLKHVEKP